MMQSSASSGGLTNEMLDKMLKMQQPSADMAGAHAIGPKKIHVFPKKKKFPDKPRSPGFGPAITHDQGI